MGWHALFVNTGEEDKVRKMIYQFLDETDIHVIVPKRRLTERKQGKSYEIIKKIFPGYVFLNTQMNVEIYYELQQIPQYCRLLNQYDNHIKPDKKKSKITMGNSVENTNDVFSFSKIDEEEMTQVLQLIGNGEVIDYSTLYVENAKVTVLDGPLKGKEGIIKKIDKRKKRARIALTFMGDEKVLDIGIQMLTP
ncbi:antiterminator LoaP [Bacillus sp. RC252]|uniref:antiterminator LoaP n=1 Tax=Bacillus sp. RC252 TaxID=3156289 RepID=UPI003838E72A